MSGVSKCSLKCLDDAQALCAAAADEFVRAYTAAVEARTVFRVALAGGSTPCRLHRILTESPYREKVSWDRVEFYFADERSVHPEHPDSNFRMANDTLLTELGKELEIHRYDGAGHGFMSSSGPECYREAQAKDSWAKGLEFLARHLQP